MDYFECPNEYDGSAPGVFLAGGITGCPDWQADACRELADLPIAVFNPRRDEFPIDDPNASEGQIDWEYRHLSNATAVLFWFPASGPIPQPIALLELGVHAALGKPIAVGCDPAYVRRADVVHQLARLRPDVTVRYGLTVACKDLRGLLADLTVEQAGGAHLVEPASGDACPTCGSTDRPVRYMVGCGFRCDDPRGWHRGCSVPAQA